MEILIKIIKALASCEKQMKMQPIIFFTCVSLQSIYMNIIHIWKIMTVETLSFNFNLQMGEKILKICKFEMMNASCYVTDKGSIT